MSMYLRFTSSVAGIELANALLAHAHGHRPVNLVGYGLGARVIFFCMKELTKFPKEAAQIIQDVTLLGCPIGSEREEWKVGYHCRLPSHPRSSRIA